MQTINVLKGDTIVGWVEVTDAASPEGTLRIGSLVGSIACGAAGVGGTHYVNDYWVDWKRLDDRPALDAKPWGLTPHDGKDEADDAVSVAQSPAP
jgi:hypothetical protein